MTEQHRPERGELSRRTPLEELLAAALLTAELAEAHLPHVVIAEVGPHREQVLIGPCSSGLDAMLASVPLEQELRREFPDKQVLVRVAPVHPITSHTHGLGAATRPTGPVTR